MRRDIEEYLKFYLKEDCVLLNKSEIARRFNCDQRIVDRYLKLQNTKAEDGKKKRTYSSLLDDYKSIIIEKVDTHHLF